MDMEQKNGEQELGNRENVKGKEDAMDEKDFFYQFLESINQTGDGEKVTIENVVFNFKNFNNINNTNGIVAGDDTKIEDIQFHTIKDGVDSKQECILLSENQFNDWLSKHYETYSMALLAAAAVFDAFPYTWVVRAAEILCRRFHFQKEEEEKTYGFTKTLGQFGAVLCSAELNTYAGKIPVEVVKLTKKEYQEIILKNIWRECPKLHDDIMQWLEDYIFQNQMSMSKRAAEIMGRLISWDYYYFLDHMVKRIPQENCLSTDVVIAQNILALSQERIYEKNVYNLLHVWSREKNIHYLLTALFICTEICDTKDILENIITAYVNRAMKEIYVQMPGVYMQHIKEFFAAGVRSFTFYRILIEQIYGHLNTAFPRIQRDVCKLFIGLFAADLRLAQFNNGEDAIFIKLCMTNHAISNQLCCIWQAIWQFRQFRQTFYDMISKYVRKSGPNNGTQLEAFIKQALGGICTDEIQNDICRKIHRRAGNE